MDSSMQEALWGRSADGAGFSDADLLLGGSLDLGGQPPGAGALPPYGLGGGAQAAGAPGVAAAGALFPSNIGAAGLQPELLMPMPMIPSGSGAGSAGSGGSSGAAGGSVPQDQPSAKPLSKKEIARQKNREKQARFRARQKERKAALEEQYESAAADLERAKLEHDELEQRSKLLEAVQATKDTAVGILSASSGRPMLAPPGGVADGRWQQAAALPAPAGAQQAQQVQQPALKYEQVQQQMGGQAAGVPRSSSGASLGTAPGGGTWVSYLLSLSFRERVDLCTSIFRGTASAKQALVEKAGRRPDGFALDIEVKQQLAQQLTDKHPQVLEAALAMTSDMVLQEWASFGEYVNEVVTSFDAGRINEVEAEKRLVPAVVYQTILNTLHCLHKPDVARKLSDHNRLPGEGDEAAAARWRQVVIDIGVTREQAAALVPIYRDYCAKEAQLLSESALSLQTLREIQQALSQQLLALDQSLSASALQYVSLFDAAGQLSHQPDSALWILAKLYGAAGAVVSPLQKARMCSLCRPLHPDVPVLVREALLLHGLLPEDLGGQCGMSLRGGAAPAALGAGQPRLPIEQPPQP